MHSVSYTSFALSFSHHQGSSEEIDVCIGRIIPRVFQTCQRNWTARTEKWLTGSSHKEEICNRSANTGRNATNDRGSGDRSVIYAYEFEMHKIQNSHTYTFTYTHHTHTQACAHCDDRTAKRTVYHENKSTSFKKRPTLITMIENVLQILHIM